MAVITFQQALDRLAAFEAATESDVGRRVSTLLGQGLTAAQKAAARANIGAAARDEVVLKRGRQTVFGDVTFERPVGVPAGSIPQDRVTGLPADLASKLDAADIAGKADDNAVVKLTGDQTKAGVLTLSSAPVVPDASFAQAKVVGLVADLAGKADDAAVVKLAGAQTVTGAINFTTAPTVPDGSFAQAKVTNLTTDLAAKAADNAVVKLTGDQTAAGVKTFSSAPVVPDNSFTQAKVTNLVTDLASKADANAVVDLTTTQTVAGVKTFSSAPVVPDGSFTQAKVTGLTTDLAGKISTALIDAANGVASKKSVRGSVTDYGAVLDGVADDTAAIQAAIDAIGTPYMPPGTAKITAPLLLRANGDGLVGAGAELSKLRCYDTAFKRDPASGGIKNVFIQGLSIYPDPSIVTSHANSQLYADKTMIDVGGISFGRFHDISSDQWDTHWDLGFVSGGVQTFKNVFTSLRAWNGRVFVFFEGDVSRNGANANVFVGCSSMAMSIHYQIQAALNTIVAARCENPLQSASYPATGIAFQFDGGLYAIQNSVIGSYVELVGTGNYNIKVTGSGWLGPNEILGGVYSKTSAVDLGGNARYGFTVNAMQLPNIQQMWDDPRTTLRVKQHTAYGEQTVAWDGSAFKTYKYDVIGDAAPTVGTFPVGAYTHNNAPSIGEPAGWTCTAAGTPGTWVPTGTVGGEPGVVELDSFAGANDDAKMAAALTYAAAQTRVPAIRLRHGVTTLANSYDMFTGMKVVGAGTENMAFGEEVGSGKAVISKVRFTGASGTSSLFKSAATINYVTVANLAFHGDADCQIFQSTGNVYGAQFHNLDFYGCLSAFGNATNKFLMTFSHFTGFWTVNAPAGTQFWLGGSDNTLWMGGQANIGGNPSTAGAGLYLVELQGLSKTNVGYAYITANNGWRGLRTSGDCTGLTLYGGVYEGQNDGDPSYGNLIRCEGTGTVRIRDPFLAYGMTSPAGTEHGIVEVACSANGQVLLDGFTYRRDNDVAETVPVAYVSGGTLRVLNGMADKQYNTWTGLPRVQNAGGTLTNDATVTVV